MRDRFPWLRLVPWLAMLAVSASAGGPLRAGRALPDGRDARLHVGVGMITEIDVMVQETRRVYYDVTGRQIDQSSAESYSLDDFDMGGGFPCLTLGMDAAWTYFSLQADLALMNPDTATTARRDYYLNVGDVTYNQVTYDQMLIRRGTPFSADLLGATLELRGLITPFTLHVGEMWSVTPWIDLGLYLVGGQYDIDAGPAAGVTQYQTPPEDFVIGGRAKNLVAGGLPEWGLGGELRYGEEGAWNLVVQAHYAVCRYAGSSLYFTSADHREKDVDIDHLNLRLRAMLDFPLADGRAFSLGVQYQRVDSTAEITSQARPLAQVLARRERFDKVADFELSAITLSAGLTF